MRLRLHHRMVRRILAVATIGGGLLPAIASSTATTSSGIRGLVFIGPVCPVERYPPDPDCAPRPYVATIWFRSATTYRVVRSVRSAPTGRFSVALAPGVYVVEPRPGRAIARPKRPHRTVRVHPGRFSAIRIDYDSGIR